MPSPAAAGIPAATVYMFVNSAKHVTDYRASWLVLAMVLVPAILMVSTIRYPSDWQSSSRKLRRINVRAKLCIHNSRISNTSNRQRTCCQICCRAA